MYSSGYSYNHYRPNRDSVREKVRRAEDLRSSYVQSPWVYHTSGMPIKSTVSYKPFDTSSNPSSTPTHLHRPRYTRSSTTSNVAQLLSDSCSSLFQKLTTRVRGLSTTVERQLPNDNFSTPSTNSLSNSTSSRGFVPLSNSKSTTVVPNFGHTITRLEDKYSSVLDKIYKKSKVPEKTPVRQVPHGRALTKSSTTVNCYYPEKSIYNDVRDHSTTVYRREKTPYKESRKSLHSTRHYPEPQYVYLDKDSAYRVRHKSNHSELRPRRSSKPNNRNGLSEVNRLIMTILLLVMISITFTFG